jgi:hypothetical protein
MHLYRGKARRMTYSSPIGDPTVTSPGARGNDVSGR